MGLYILSDIEFKVVIKWSMTKCDSLNENGLYRLKYLMFDFRLVELFGKDYEVWLCWRRCATECRFWGFKSLWYLLSISALSFSLSASWLFSQHVALSCDSSTMLAYLLICMFPVMRSWTHHLKMYISPNQMLFSINCHGRGISSKQ